MPCHTPLETVPNSVISNAFISDLLWSAVALASIAFNFDKRAAVNGSSVAFTAARSVHSLSINAPAAATFVASVTSALASIASNLFLSVVVKFC